MPIEALAVDRNTAARIAALTRRLSVEATLGASPDIALVASDYGHDRACASLWWTSVPSLAGQTPGLVGHYAAADLETGAAVLRSACDMLRARGATMAVGPMDGSTWRHYRLVTWRGDEPPFLLEPDNPPDWPRHFERAGFGVLAGYHSSCCDSIDAIEPDYATKERMLAAGFRLRAFDVAHLDAELHAMWEVASDAFARNLLYAPISEREFRQIYGHATAIAPPELTTIVERDRRMAGFVFSYPDTLRVPADTVVIKTAGVVAALQRHGIGQFLFDAALAAVRDAGYRRVIYALMRDGNVSTHFGRETRRLIRRYALYSRLL